MKTPVRSSAPATSTNLFDGVQAFLDNDTYRPVYWCEAFDVGACEGESQVMLFAKTPDNKVYVQLIQLYRAGEVYGTSPALRTADEVLTGVPETTLTTVWGAADVIALRGFGFTTIEYTALVRQCLEILNTTVRETT
jgi:hypothetical protein